MSSETMPNIEEFVCTATLEELCHIMRLIIAKRADEVKPWLKTVVIGATQDKRLGKSENQEFVLQFAAALAKNQIELSAKVVQAITSNAPLIPAACALGGVSEQHSSTAANNTLFAEENSATDTDDENTQHSASAQPKRKGARRKPYWKRAIVFKALAKQFTNQSTTGKYTAIIADLGMTNTNVAIQVAKKVIEVIFDKEANDLNDTHVYGLLNNLKRASEANNLKSLTDLLAWATLHRKEIGKYWNVQLEGTAEALEFINTSELAAMFETAFTTAPTTQSTLRSVISALLFANSDDKINESKLKFGDVLGHKVLRYSIKQMKELWLNNKWPTGTKCLSFYSACTHLVLTVAQNASVKVICTDNGLAFNNQEVIEKYVQAKRNWFYGKAWSTIGNMLFNKNPNGAVQAYYKAIQYAPMIKEVHYNMGCLLQNEGKNIRGAEEAFREAINLDSKYAKAHTNLGALLEYHKKDVDGAEAAYRAAIDADPNHAQANNNLGKLLDHKRNDVDGAEAAYRAAIKADPGYENAHINLAYLLKNKRKNLDAAKAAYRDAIELDPNGAPLYYNNLGNLLMNDCKHVDEAEVAYRKAIDADRKCAQAHFNLGHLLKLQRNMDGAEAAYRAAIDADPKYAKAYKTLGYLLQTERKDMDGAEEAYRKALDINRNDAKVHVYLGQLLQHGRKKLKDAEQAYRKAIELDPDCDIAHTNLGAVLRQRNKRKAEESSSSGSQTKHPRCNS